MKQQRIVFFVCPNGFGHLKRVSSVVASLCEQSKDQIIDIVLDDRYRDNPDMWGYSTSFHSNVNYCYADFSVISYFNQNQKFEYSVEDYQNWWKELKIELNLDGEEILVSDNLAGVLSISHSAWLMGSFLWSDLYTEGDNSYIDNIVNYEKELLLENRPPIFCLKDFVLPEVQSQCECIEVGWFTDMLDYPRANTKNILITGGGTGLSDKELSQCAIWLSENGEEILVDRRIQARLAEENHKAHPFSFEDSDFKKLYAVIGRPGIGIITECIKFGIPIICWNGEPNNELQHNCREIEKAQFGLKLDKVDDLPQLFTKFKSQHSQFSLNIKTQTANGHSAVAEYLLKTIKGRK